MADRRLTSALLVAGFALAAVHVRLYRNEQLARGQGTLSAATRLRSWTHDIFPRERAMDHAITMAFDIDVRDTIELSFVRQPRLTSAPVAFDVLDRPVPVEARITGEQTTISFPPPPPALGGVRQITIAFSTGAPEPTYGWGYRALAVPWASTLAPARVPTIVQAHVTETISAHGFRCSEEPSGRVCAIDAHRRRALAVPIAPVADLPYRLGFALALGIVLSALMYAIYRRWEALADRLGLGADVRPSRTSRLSMRLSMRLSIDDDPLETAALVARGITAVLGVVAAVFFVGTVEGGFMPLIAPLALSLWALVAGTTMVVAVGVDRPRPWGAMLAVVVLAALALHPRLRWILPGLAALAAAVTMQLTSLRTKPPR